jgi:hypothetical protein
VDDRVDGEKLYPASLLRKWKQDREGADGQALDLLGRTNEEELASFLTAAFQPPLDRLQAIADQLEKTGTITQDSVVELRKILDLVQDSEGVDYRTAQMLGFAAETLGTNEFYRSAAALADAAEILPSIVNQIETASHRITGED